MKQLKRTRFGIFFFFFFFLFFLLLFHGGGYRIIFILICLGVFYEGRRGGRKALPGFLGGEFGGRINRLRRSSWERRGGGGTPKTPPPRIPARVLGRDACRGVGGDATKTRAVCIAEQRSQPRRLYRTSREIQKIKGNFKKNY